MESGIIIGNYCELMHLEVQLETAFSVKRENVVMLGYSIIEIFRKIGT